MPEKLQSVYGRYANVGKYNLVIEGIRGGFDRLLTVSRRYHHEYLSELTNDFRKDVTDDWIVVNNQDFHLRSGRIWNKAR